MGKAALIKTQHLVKKFLIGGRQFTALKDINLNFETGKLIGSIILNLRAMMSLPLVSELVMVDNSC